MRERTSTSSYPSRSRSAASAPGGDISPRAVALSTLNARLNGLDARFAVSGLSAAGASFYPWPTGSHRFVCSWATGQSEIDALAATLAG